MWWCVSTALAVSPASDWSRSSPYDVAATGDLNADGFDDLVLVNANEDCSVHLGSANGLGASVAAVPCSRGHWAGYDDAIAIVDGNGDGAAELVTLEEFQGGFVGEVQVYDGVPGGTFDVSTDWEYFPDHGGGGIPLQYGQFGEIEVGDFNGDGYGDFCVDGVFQSVYTECFHGSAGGFGTTATSFSSVGFKRRAAGDFDGDGDADLAIADNGVASVKFYPGRPTGLASAPSRTVAIPTGRANVGRQLEAIGDLDGDGDDELVISASGGGTYEYWLLVGTPNGPANPTLAFPPAACSANAAPFPDLDANGIGDLLAKDPCFGQNRGTAGILVDLTPPMPQGLVQTLRPPSAQPEVSLDGSAMKFGDFNGNGLWDWVYWSGGRVEVNYDAQ